MTSEKWSGMDGSMTIGEGILAALAKRPLFLSELQLALAPAHPANVLLLWHIATQ